MQDKHFNSLYYVSGLVLLIYKMLLDEKLFQKTTTQKYSLLEYMCVRV